MNIGISGASGQLGAATVRELKARLGAKANIVGISRTPDKIAAPGVEARAGDFDKPETLTDPLSRDRRRRTDHPPIPAGDGGRRSDPLLGAPARRRARERSLAVGVDGAVAFGAVHSIQGGTFFELAVQRFEP